MYGFRRSALRNWPRHRQKVRYLLVGGWNTLVWYACFALFYYLLQKRLPPSAILVIAYAVASMNGYLTFRYLVFAPVRHPVVEYLRYQAVYLPILALNLVVLPLALTINVNPFVAQGLCSAFALVAAYIGNKYFAFDRPKMRT
jgi:putative flippase GtrA